MKMNLVAAAEAGEGEAAVVAAMGAAAALTGGRPAEGGCPVCSAASRASAAPSARSWPSSPSCGLVRLPCMRTHFRTSASPYNPAKLY